MGKSNISWCDMVWNPVTGCTPADIDCKNCYAADLHGKRHAAYIVHDGLDKNGNPMAAQYAKSFSIVQVLPDRFDLPLHWKKPRTIFVDSMGDLFHPDVPVEAIHDIYDVMQACPRHTFIVCTKRPERIVPVLYGEEGGWNFGGGDYLPNVWHLTSVCDQETAEKRIPELLKLRAQSPGWPGLGISAEPLLGTLDLSRWLWLRRRYESGRDIREIDLVIAGCESGSKRRHAEDEWFRRLRDDCEAAGTRFYLKQMEIGGRVVTEPYLDGRKHLALPWGGSEPK